MYDHMSDLIIPKSGKQFLTSDDQRPNRSNCEQKSDWLKQIMRGEYIFSNGRDLKFKSNPKKGPTVIQEND